MPEKSKQPKDVKNTHPHDSLASTPAPEEPQKNFWQKLWWFIWSDNSVWSWIANILIAFILIKFLVYPGLGLVLGTNYPIVAVVSGSMEHQGSFDSWWASKCIGGTQADVYEQLNITKEQFKDFKFPNGFNTGDLMVLYSPKHIQRGDVAVFGVATMKDPIIHRVVRVDETYMTKGDHNCRSDVFEQNIPQEAIVGKAVLRIPYLGWIKIAAVDFLNLILGRA